MSTCISRQLEFDTRRKFDDKLPEESDVEQPQSSAAKQARTQQRN